jgi:hypothetical protein
MKNLKKLLAVALSLAILLTLTVPVMAAELTAAEKVELLGILQGEGDGVTDEYLAKATTRIQGTILLLRLLGKEDEALAYAGQDNFTDVVGNEWYASVTAYVKANPSIGFVGYPDGSFQPRKVMTGAELYKVLLTALGYIQDVDYTWAQVAQKAAELGLASIDDPSAPITNNDMAVAILEALQAETKSGVAFIDSLIADGIISAADAAAAGLVTQLAIISAVPTNADEITVTFSKPVEGDPAITVKSGFMNVFVNKKWNDAKTQVVLNRPNSIAFAEGTYELSVGDLTATVKFEKEVAQSLAIVTTTVQIGIDAEVELALYNQYGKKMNVAGQNFSATAFNKTKGNVLMVSPGSANNKFKITIPGGSATAENDIIVVTAMHHQSTIVGQAELTAVLESKVMQFAMTGVVIPEGSNTVNTTHSSVQITYEAYDQYGKKITLKSLTNVNEGSGLTFISSDETILKVSDMKFDKDGKLTFEPLKAGTVTLSVLVNSAAVVTSLPITVFDPAAVDKVVIGGPLKEVVEGETTEIEFTALDQFGNEIEKKHVTLGDDDLTFNVVGVTGKVEWTLEDGKLSVKPLEGTKGYVTVYYYWKKQLQGSFSLNVWEKAIATNIEGVTLNGDIELDATQKLELKNIKVVDQYGRVYKDLKSDYAPALAVEDFVLTSNPATDGKVTATTNGGFVFAADSTTEGSVEFTLKLKGKDASAYSFTLKAVDVYKAENGVTYAFASVPTLYSGKFADATAAADYAKAMSLTGKTKDGTVVTLKGDKIFRLLSSNINIAVDGLKIYSKVDSAQTTTIRAYDEAGKLLAQADVNATKGRTISSVVFGSDLSMAPGEYGLVAKLGFKVNDQYGVNMVATNASIIAADAFDLQKDGFFAYEVSKDSSDSAGISFDYVNKTFTVTGQKGDVITLTYVANNGLRDSIVITLTEPAV